MSCPGQGFGRNVGQIQSTNGHPLQPRSSQLVDWIQPAGLVFPTPELTGENAQGPGL